MAEHLLTRLFAGIGLGRMPVSDGRLEVVGSPPGPADAVVAFTGCNVIAAGVDPAEILARVDRHDLAAPMEVPFLLWLAERLGSRPTLPDITFVFQGRAQPIPDWLMPTDRVTTHPRVQRSLRYRTDVRVYEDAERSCLLVIGRGLGGRWEVSLEVGAEHRGRGLGRKLAAIAPSLATDGEPVFYQTAPGNAASVRAALASGYVPIGAEVLFLRSRR